jgi:hypothetical protein
MLLTAALIVAGVAIAVGLVALLSYRYGRESGVVYVHQRCQRPDCEACNAWERGREKNE